MAQSADDSNSATGNLGASFDEEEVDDDLDMEADSADPVAQEMELVGGAAAAASSAASAGQKATVDTLAAATRERRSRAAIVSRRRRRVCIVPQCYSSECSNPPVLLHSFPQSPAVSELWKRCVANPKLSTVASKLLCERQYVVCSLHFEDVCYENPATRRLTNAESARLLWNAVPTLGLAGGRSDSHPNGGLPLYSGSSINYKPAASTATAPAATVAAAATATASAATASSASIADGSCSDSSDFNDGNLVIVKPEQPLIGESLVGPSGTPAQSQQPKTLQPRQQQSNGVSISASASSSSTSSASAIQVAAVSSAPAANATSTTPVANGNASNNGQEYNHEFTLLNRIVRIALSLDQVQTGMLRELCSLKRKQKRQQEVLSHLCDQLARSVENANTGSRPDSTAATAAKRIRRMEDADGEGDGGGAV